MKYGKMRLRMKAKANAFLAFLLLTTPAAAQDARIIDNDGAQQMIEYCLWFATNGTCEPTITNTCKLGCIDVVTKRCMERVVEPRVFELLSCIELEQRAWLFHLTTWEQDYAQSLAVADRLTPHEDSSFLDSYLATKGSWSQYQTAQCGHESMARGVPAESASIAAEILISNQLCLRNTTALRALELHGMMNN